MHGSFHIIMHQQQPISLQRRFLFSLVMLRFGWKSGWCITDYSLPLGLMSGSWKSDLLFHQNGVKIHKPGVNFTLYAKFRLLGDARRDSAVPPRRTFLLFTSSLIQPLWYVFMNFLVISVPRVTSRLAGCLRSALNFPSRGSHHNSQRLSSKPWKCSKSVKSFSPHDKKKCCAFIWKARKKGRVGGGCAF